jgi:hypothetical protein
VRVNLGLGPPSASIIEDRVFNALELAAAIVEEGCEGIAGIPPPSPLIYIYLGPRAPYPAAYDPRIRMYVCIYIYRPARSIIGSIRPAYMYVCIYVCMYYVSMYIRMYVCVCVYIYIFIYICL